jgi:CRISPR-associated protein Csb2
MGPLPKVHGVHVFAIEAGISENLDEANVVRALRRAVMARVQASIGAAETLPPFFSGHEPDGRPAKSEQHSHLAFVFDRDGSRLLIIAPHVIDRRAARPDERGHLETLERAVAEMCELRAGRAGLLRIRPTTVQVDTDPLFAASQNWESVTPYRVTRHARGVTAKEALAIDLRAECQRRGLPLPSVVTSDCRSLPGVGLEGRVSLHFDVVVEGPLLLGKTRQKGGGLFRCSSRDTRSTVGDPLR